MYEFTGQRAVAIWLKWVVASGVAWLAVHPEGTTAQRDLVLLLAGGALASALHGLVLWSRNLGQDVRIAWLVGSMAAWGMSVTAIVLVPRARADALASERLIVLGLLAAGIAVGLGQAWSIGDWPRHRFWIPTPALGLTLAAMVSVRFHGAMLVDPWIAEMAEPTTMARAVGTVFGLTYGAFTGAVLIWVGRGREALTPRPNILEEFARTRRRIDPDETSAIID